MHDGSESTKDAVIFEIELSSSRTPLDPEMRVRQRFRLQISIRPTNDVPSIGNQNRNKNSIHQGVLWSVLFYILLWPSKGKFPIDQSNSHKKLPQD